MNVAWGQCSLDCAAISYCSRSSNNVRTKPRIWSESPYVEFLSSARESSTRTCTYVPFTLHIVEDRSSPRGIRNPIAKPLLKDDSVATTSVFPSFGQIFIAFGGGGGWCSMFEWHLQGTTISVQLCTCRILLFGTLPSAGRHCDSNQ